MFSLLKKNIILISMDWNILSLVLMIFIFTAFDNKLNKKTAFCILFHAKSNKRSFTNSFFFPSNSYPLHYIYIDLVLWLFFFLSLLQVYINRLNMYIKYSFSHIWDFYFFKLKQKTLLYTFYSNTKSTLVSFFLDWVSSL